MSEVAPSTSMAGPPNRDLPSEQLAWEAALSQVPILTACIVQLDFDGGRKPPEQFFCLLCCHSSTSKFKQRVDGVQHAQCCNGGLKRVDGDVDWDGWRCPVCAERHVGKSREECARHVVECHHQYRPCHQEACAVVGWSDAAFDPRLFANFVGRGDLVKRLDGEGRAQADDALADRRRRISHRVRRPVEAAMPQYVENPPPVGGMPGIVSSLAGPVPSQSKPKRRRGSRRSSAPGDTDTSDAESEKSVAAGSDRSPSPSPRKREKAAWQQAFADDSGPRASLERGRELGHSRSSEPRERRRSPSRDQTPVSERGSRREDRGGDRDSRHGRSSERDRELKGRRDRSGERDRSRSLRVGDLARLGGEGMYAGIMVRVEQNAGEGDFKVSVCEWWEVSTDSLRRASTEEFAPVGREPMPMRRLTTSTGELSNAHCKGSVGQLSEGAKVIIEGAVVTREAVSRRLVSTEFHGVNGCIARTPRDG